MGGLGCFGRIWYFHLEDFTGFFLSWGEANDPISHIYVSTAMFTNLKGLDMASNPDIHLQSFSLFGVFGYLG